MVAPATVQGAPGRATAAATSWTTSRCTFSPSHAACLQQDCTALQQLGRCQVLWTCQRCEGLTTQVLDALKTRGVSIRVASPKLVMEEAPESYKVRSTTCCAYPPPPLACGRLQRQLTWQCPPGRDGGGGHLPRSRHLQEVHKAAPGGRHQRLMPPGCSGQHGRSRAEAIGNQDGTAGACHSSLASLDMAI